jgi:hypothetical protein
MKSDNQNEYDFSRGVRSKYYAKYLNGTNTVVLEPEIAKMFTDSASVNDALRTLIRAAGHNKTLQRTRKARRRA